jgi:ParB family chromosome partitioning protein
LKARSGLGKGLEALIPQIAQDRLNEVVHIYLSDLTPNPYQPRRDFNQEKLEELVNSVREHGILQPIVVRKRASGGFEIIAGERRFRAVQLIGNETIPALVRDITDQEAMEIALIENLQRDDLNPVEVAEAYKRFMDLFSLTQEQLADRVGQSRSHVANLLRLLSLPQEVLDDVSRGTISMGHARALIGLKDNNKFDQILTKIKEQGLSVRSVESIVQNEQNVSRETKKQNPNNLNHNPQIQNYENQMREHLGTLVKIKHHNGKGKIEIEYYNDEDLSRILTMFSGLDIN